MQDHQRQFYQEVTFNTRYASIRLSSPNYKGSWCRGILSQFFFLSTILCHPHPANSPRIQGSSVQTCEVSNSLVATNGKLASIPSLRSDDPTLPLHYTPSIHFKSHQAITLLSQKKMVFFSMQLNMHDINNISIITWSKKKMLQSGHNR